ncbi:MAG: IS30 family transposase [Bacteroidaceae bacterium]|nr:IS30 family transposase [Bacteroidaceae bacterium]
MDQVNVNTHHTKGKHLTFEDRMIIQIRLNDKRSIREIAKEIGCSPGTVLNEKERGSVSLYSGKVVRYKAAKGQIVYETNRLACGRHYDLLSKHRFLDYVTEKFTEEHWSLDACVGRALESGEFSRDEIVCTKTLYNYVTTGLIGIKNVDLPEKLKRKTTKKVFRENKKKLGRSIEERPASVDDRNEFGHWECDLVIGHKSKDDKVLLTLIERLSRQYWMIPLDNRQPETVMNAFKSIFADYSEHSAEVFKTITTDNGSEFSSLADLEEISSTLVYFAHPYTSCEKGSNERHNGLIRRFIPKHRRIDDYSPEQIAAIEVWANSLPRKILGYKTPDEVFEAELDKIYSQRSA